ncbi:MAG: carboxypeptidase-like regulatory domain-containing protein, partial [Gemmatimonadetes bacterium]|nr:carboxypeptidase-like regulatory domain-containing protein [Gemmatimonadota bacterium]
MRILTLARAGIAAAALTLAVLAPIHAQERVAVTGHVLQEATGAPVDGALVRIEGRDGGAVTDSTGAFEFDGLPPGLPALLLADKVLDRLERAGVATSGVERPSGRSTPEIPGVERPSDRSTPGPDDLGARLMALVAEARAT